MKNLEILKNNAISKSEMNNLVGGEVCYNCSIYDTDGYLLGNGTACSYTSDMLYNGLLYHYGNFSCDWRHQVYI